MSPIQIRDLHRRSAGHLPTGRAGNLRLQERVAIRGKGAKTSVTKPFEAIFTFDEPLICALSDVPDYGGYFLQEGGCAEVTQLVARVATVEERAALLKSLFAISLYGPLRAKPRSQVIPASTRKRDVSPSAKSSVA